MKKRLLLLLIGAGILGYLLWPKPVRPGILSAYSDNFAGMWALTLYQDGGFHLSLPAAEEEGRFRLAGDTIELHYATAVNWLPAAYCINRQQKRLDELHRRAGRWVVTDNTNWMQLQQESVRQYRRE